MTSNAEATSSKLNFLFHLKSKTNLVFLWKCNSHLQYYKIDLSFSIKLQEINLYVCEEYKTEREARQSNRALYFKFKMTTVGFILAYDLKTFVTSGNSLFCRDFANLLRRLLKTLRLTLVEFLRYLFYRTLINIILIYINKYILYDQPFSFTDYSSTLKEDPSAPYIKRDL